MERNIKILVIDPNFDYWNAIKEQSDWSIEFDICFTKNKLISHLKNNVYSLIIANLDYYNCELINSRYKSIRAIFEGPIIFLSEETTTRQRINWMGMGIYDIWSKQIHYQELQLKIIRIGELEINKYTYELADYIVNEQKQTIRFKGKVLKLAPIPYKLLIYLISHPNVDLNREILLKDVWNYNVTAGERVVDKNINTLRKRTNDNRIKSVYGHGYRFDYSKKSEEEDYEDNN